MALRIVSVVAVVVGVLSVVAPAHAFGSSWTLSNDGSGGITLTANSPGVAMSVAQDATNLVVTSDGGTDTIALASLSRVVIDMNLCNGVVVTLDGTGSYPVAVPELRVVNARRPPSNPAEVYVKPELRLKGTIGSGSSSALNLSAPIVLLAATTLRTSGPGLLTTPRGIDGAYPLTVNAGTWTASAGIGGTTPLAALDVDAESSISLAGSVRTTDEQTYSGPPIAVQGPVTLAASRLVANVPGIRCGAAGCGEVTIDVTEASRFDGVIGGAGSDGAFDFVKAGAGTLTLAGKNYVRGSSEVQDGELRVTGSLGGSTDMGNVIVGRGGRLTGTGNVGGGGGGLIVRGVLDLDGTRPESLTTSNVDLYGGTLVVGVDSKSSYSQLDVASGGVSLSDGPRLRVSAGPSLADGAKAVIVRKTDVGAVEGAFAGLAEGGIVKPVSGEGRFRISYKGGDGNDITLTYDTSTADDSGSGSGSGGGSGGGLGLNTTAPKISASGVISTRVTAKGAGTIRLVATILGGGRAAKAYCRATAVAKRKGPVTVRCTPTAAAIALATGKRLRVVTTFTPKGKGKPLSSAKTIDGPSAG